MCAPLEITIAIHQDVSLYKEYKCAMISNQLGTAFVTNSSMRQSGIQSQSSATGIQRSRKPAEDDYREEPVSLQAEKAQKI
jgi:hypothetical protein